MLTDLKIRSHGDALPATRGRSVDGGAARRSTSLRVERLEVREVMDAEPVGPPFLLHPEAVAGEEYDYDPQVAFAPNGDFVVVWMAADDETSVGIYARRFTAAGTPLGDKFLVNTTTAGRQGPPVIAMDDEGDFVVAWEGFDGQGFQIYGQLFDETGARVGEEFQISQSPTQAIAVIGPSVAMDADGDFVVAWNTDYEFGEDSEVMARRYNAAGVAQGGEFQVNAASTMSQVNGRVAMDDAGNFVVVWQEFGADAGDDSLWGRRYDATGNAVGGPFLLVDPAPFGYGPEIAMDADGDFVVVWSEYSDGSGGEDVFARRFNALGVGQGDAFQVNSYTASSQTFRTPGTIAMSDDGDFVIVWTSDGQDGQESALYARRYDASGVADGGELKVDVGSESDNYWAGVAMDDAGDFVVVWASYLDSGESRIQGRLFTTAAVGPPVVVINGTNGKDTIKVDYKRGVYTVQVNGVTWDETYTAVTRFEIYGFDADDSIKVSQSVAVPCYIEGGLGNDVIASGSGDDVILGGAGNDTIKGGRGRNILIGGLGKDTVEVTLTGGTAADGSIMIGDATDHDGDKAALLALSAAWKANDAGADATVRTAFNSTTVHGDGQVDTLTSSKTVTDLLFSFDLKPNGSRLDSLRIQAGDRVN